MSQSATVISIDHLEDGIDFLPWQRFPDGRDGILELNNIDRTAVVIVESREELLSRITFLLFVIVHCLLKGVESLGDSNLDEFRLECQKINFFDASFVSRREQGNSFLLGQKGLGASGKLIN